MIPENTRFSFHCYSDPGYPQNLVILASFPGIKPFTLYK